MFSVRQREARKNARAGPAGPFFLIGLIFGHAGSRHRHYTKNSPKMQTGPAFPAISFTTGAEICAAHRAAQRLSASEQNKKICEKIEFRIAFPRMMAYD